MKKRHLAAAAVMLLAHAAHAQTPAGSTFRVNVFTTGVPWDAVASVDPAGRFVVAWTASDGQDGNGNGLLARRFSSTGSPLGGELVVNESTTGNQVGLSMAGDARGGFVATWVDESRLVEKGRRFDDAGRPLGGDFLLGHESSSYSRVAPTPEGGFLVVWAQNAQPSGSLVFGHRYDAAGTPAPADFQVNTLTGGRPHDPAVAVGPNGHFVVAWLVDDGDVYGIHAQRFSPSGARMGGEFQVNVTTLGYQSWGVHGQDHVLAVDRDGGFVVTWDTLRAASGYAQVFGRRFDAAGNGVGAEFRVGTSSTDRQNAQARVAMDDGGNFAVAFHQFVATNDIQVRVRRFDAAGAPRGAELTVSGNSLFAYSPDITSDPAGNLVVAWLDNDLNTALVRAQRYGGLLPSALEVDTGDNGVLEAGETADVRPTWLNVNGLAQTFSGTFARLTGPAGATYAIIDGAADYGTAPNGGPGGCGSNCYAVSVSGARPLQHWDAEALEKLAPDSQGQNKAWPLHVGGSFGDVPRSSPFYRSVETLLHRGITSGCGAGAFCPGASTTREQMAVFVLLAREGATYLPPPCGVTPLFSDVPPSSPYCRWVEELARRGVTGGCAASRFCPGSAVPRDQMAVFLLHMLDPTLNPPACTTPLFNDVPASSPFCRWVEELARRGITGGCGGGSYCPGAAVTRDQMSAFLTAPFGLTLYGP